MSESDENPLTPVKRKRGVRHLENYKHEIQRLKRLRGEEYVTGLLPVVVDGVPFPVARASTSLRLYSASLAVANCLGFYQWFWQLIFIQSPVISPLFETLSTATIVIVSTSTTLSISLAAVVTLMVAVFRVHPKIQLMERLREVEMMLCYRDTSHKANLGTYFVLVNTAGVAIYSFCSFILDSNFSEAFITVYKVLIISGIIELAELVLSVRDWFQLVNARVEEIVARSRSKDLIWTTALACVEGFSMPQELTLSLSELSEIHWKLCCIVQDINAIYGSQLVFTTCFLFLHLICHPYYFFFLSMNDHFTGHFWSMTFYIDWMVIYISALFLMMWPCSAAVSEAKKTVTVVTNLMGNKMNRSVFKQLEVFAQQLFHRDIAFSACGLFNLQLSTVVTVASSVSTYMAIILQFQISVEDDDVDEKKMVLGT